MPNFFTQLINKKSSFDLEFRRDIRYERPNHPVYYRWKAQFIIVLNRNKENEKALDQVKNILKCGKIFSRNNQIRYAVQNINDLYNIIIPFLKDKNLFKNEKDEIKLWIEAVMIIFRYKGKKLAAWIKKDFQSILKIYKSISKKKHKKSLSRYKWISAAEAIFETL